MWKYRVSTPCELTRIPWLDNIRSDYTCESGTYQQHLLILMLTQQLLGDQTDTLMQSDMLT